MSRSAPCRTSRPPICDPFRRSGSRRRTWTSCRPLSRRRRKRKWPRACSTPETLKTLTTFQFEQRQAIATGELKLAKEGRDLGEKLAVLQRQREELNGGSGKTVREAVVFANFPAAGGKLRVRYLVNNASWSPSYNVRGDAWGQAGDAGIQRVGTAAERRGLDGRPDDAQHRHAVAGGDGADARSAGDLAGGGSAIVE